MSSDSPNSGSLHRALRVRHLVTLSVGGTIASGFFLGVGGAVSLGGPGVVISYLVGGLTLLGVMACLAELSVQGQTAGGFAIYAQRQLGPWVGFITGWNYWLAWVAGTAAEGVAIGTYMSSLGPFHHVPIWLTALVVVSLNFAVNLIGVLTMGNYELILSAVKIVVLLVFAGVCFAAVLGVGTPPVGLQGFTGHGGMFPTGTGGLFSSFLLVFMAFTGVEMINISSEESVRPERDVPRALMGTAAGVTILFILAVSGLVAVVPWNHVGTTSSPLDAALNAIHFPMLANVIVLAIIVSSVSAIDSGLYASSRMLFALSREGYFPRSVSRTHPTRQVPVGALLISGLCIYAGVLLAVVLPDYAFVFLGSLATLGFMWAYVLIPVLQMMYRVRLTREQVHGLRWKVPLYPLTPIVCVVLVGIAIIGPIFQNQPGLFGIDAGALPVAAGAIWVAIWTAYYLLIGRRIRRRAGLAATAGIAPVLETAEAPVLATE